MNAKGRKYLKDIDLSKTLIERVERIIKLYNNINNDEIESIFISNTFNEDGKRVFDSLWLFSDNYMIESREFATEDDFDFCSISKSRYWRSELKDYDFMKANEKSRFSLTVVSTDDFVSDFWASGNNCTYLTEILKQIFMPVIERNK